MSKVGIYSPSYNVDKYLPDLIRSLQEQTFKDWKVAILDDGSTDKSYEVVKSLSKTDDRIIVEKRPNHNGRIGFIKNETIKLLGDVEYLCSVDADDMITPRALETFVNFLDKNKNYGAACGSFECFNDEGKKWQFSHVANSNEFSSEVLLKYMCFFPMRFYRKECYDEIGGYDNNLTSAIDYDFALKLDEKFLIKRIKSPISYLYRQHSIQISQRERPEQNNNAKLALQNALKRRGLKGKVLNDTPPFQIKYEQNKHFIWRP